MTPHIEVKSVSGVLRDLADTYAEALDFANAVEVFAAIEIVDGRMASFPLLGAAQRPTTSSPGG